MELDMLAVFKAIVDANESPVVLCDMEYNIIYANDIAEHNFKLSPPKYRKSECLTGSRLDIFFDEEMMSKICMTLEWFKEDVKNNRVFAFHTPWNNGDMYMCALRKNNTLVGFYTLIEVRTADSSKPYDID